MEIDTITESALQLLKREMRAEKISTSQQEEITSITYDGLRKRFIKGSVHLDDFIKICTKMNIKPSTLLKKAEKKAEKSA